MKARDFKGYNPETDPNTSTFVQDGITLHVVDFKTLMSDVYQGNIHTLPLDSATYDDALKSTLDLTQRKLAPGNNIWLYSGKAQVPEQELGIGRVFGEIQDEMAADGTKFRIKDFYHDNSRLIISTGSNSVANILWNRTESTMVYRNESANTSQVHAEVEVRLNAPTVESLDLKPGPQLVDHVISYLHVINGLLAAIGSHKRVTRHIITPDGPHYMFPLGTRSRPPKASDATTISETTPAEKKLMLDDIGGLEEIRKTLKNVVKSFKNPETMERWGAERPRGVILYGEPGTGKTSLANAVANEIGGKFWEITSPDILGKYHGESERNIKELFDKARKIDEPTVIFFDEFDAIFPVSEDSNGGNATRNSIAGLFKTEMERLRAENPNVLVFAATNYLDKIEDSLIRPGRFDLKLYVPLPNQDARVQILSNLIGDSISQANLRSFTAFSDDINIGELADKTDGMSGAQLVEMLRRIKFLKASLDMDGKNPGPISQADLLKAIHDIRTD